MLTLILGVIGIFFWCRRRRSSPRLPVNQHGEDIPLNSSSALAEDGDGDDEVFKQRQRKGKGKAVESASPPIFDVGDDEEEYKDES